MYSKGKGNRKTFMTNYIEFLVTLGFLGALMWGMMKFMLRDITKEISLIHKDITEIKSDLKDMRQDFRKSEARIDHLYEENNRLYKILVDILKK